MRTNTPGEIIAALRPALAPPASSWLAERTEAVRADPGSALPAAFPATARNCGTAPVPGISGWNTADAARLALLHAAPLDGGQLRAEVADLYRYGDAGEKRSVLRCLDPLEPRIGESGLDLVTDALRGNDTTLIAAALGPYAARRLDTPTFRHGVLKCLFVGVPLDSIAGTAERADAELGRMTGDFCLERVAAGRDVPPDALRLLAAFPDQVARLQSETSAADEHRAAAARRALEALES